METAGRRFPYIRFVPAPRPDTGALSPIEALSAAWRATWRLLFRPFDRRRWIALSIVCLFLGGGASTAAFQWGFGALPADLHLSDVAFRLRALLAQHLSLTVLALLAGVGLFLGIIYVRCVFRFVLIEQVLRQDTTVRAAWRNLQSYGRTYFRWLFGAFAVLLALFSAGAIGSYRYFVLIREAGRPEWLASALLIADTAAVVGMGLLMAIIITLTDDLVAPLMYAQKISLPAAWRIVGKLAWEDSVAFEFYIVLRFAVGMGVSVAVLIVLFPVLMGLSAGALVTTALTILTLHLVGLEWVWNPVTISLVALALGVFTGLLFALLSVVGMPGQVYLQNYGVRFIASRVPALRSALR